MWRSSEYDNRRAEFAIGYQISNYCRRKETSLKYGKNELNRMATVFSNVVYDIGCDYAVRIRELILEKLETIGKAPQENKK